jgi:hypothetical protein
MATLVKERGVWDLHSRACLSARSVALAIAAWLFVASCASAQAIWVTGPEVRYPLDAIYRHADGDINGDGTQDVSAYCSTVYFTITDNTWPGKTGRMSATLSVGDRLYAVEAEHIEIAEEPYATMVRQVAPNAIWMSWPAEEAPDFSAEGAVSVRIDGEERDYGEGASAALNVVREQCVRNVTGPPYVADPP